MEHKKEESFFSTKWVSAFTPIVLYGMKKIDFLLDDKVYYTFANDGKGSSSWPFDQPFYLILNISVGGNFGGARGVEVENIWPQRMEIDYVRVYQ